MKPIKYCSWRIQVSYFHDFQMGNFYFSTLFFHHIIFQLIHERKFTETHQELFKMASSLIPIMKSSKSCIVTDRESANLKAAKMELSSSSIGVLESPLLRYFWLRKTQKNWDPEKNNSLHRWYFTPVSVTNRRIYQHLSEFCKTWDPLFDGRGTIHGMYVVVTSVFVMKV